MIEFTAAIDTWNCEWYRNDKFIPTFEFNADSHLEIMCKILTTDSCFRLNEENFSKSMLIDWPKVNLFRNIMVHMLKCR